MSSDYHIAFRKGLGAFADGLRYLFGYYDIEMRAMAIDVKMNLLLLITLSI